MRTVVLTAICVAALAAGGCIGSLSGGLLGSSAAEEPWDVVPGKSAGPVKMGMKSIEVHRVLGVPAEATSGMREVWIYGPNLMVAFDTDSRVVGIQMVRPGRVQWEGRWLDMQHTGKEVVSVFGDPSFVSHWTKQESDGVEHVVYGYRALGFGVLADPKTDRILGFIIAEPEPEAESAPEAPAAPAPESPPPAEPAPPPPPPGP